MASSARAEQQQRSPPTEQLQHQKNPDTVTQQSPRPSDLNQQQAAAPYDQNQQQTDAPYDPSYEAHYVSQFHDYSQAYPHHQLEAPKIHPQLLDPAYHPHFPEGYSGASPFIGGGRREGGHGGGINPNKSTPVFTLPPPLPVLKLWCEICRVECNSLDTLASHKIGRRHKKTAQRFEEMQKQQKLVAEYQANFMSYTIYTTGCQQANAIPNTRQTTECRQANAMPTLHESGSQQENTMSSTVHSSTVIICAPSVAEQEKVLQPPEIITTAEASSTQLEPLKASETISENVQVDDPNESQNLQYEQKCQVATTEGTAELPNSGNEIQLDGGQGGMKRKITKNGEGGKRLKKSHPRNIRQPRRICTVCSVACESLRTFEAHVAGRKHNSNLKKVQQHGAVFGPINVVIPPNQPIRNTNCRPEPMYYGLSSCQMADQVSCSKEGAHHANLQNQDSSLMFALKERNESENNVSNNLTSDEASTSESKDIIIMEKIVDVTEIPALDSALKERSTSEMDDTTKVAEDFSIDSASKEKSISEMDDILKVAEDFSLDSASKEKTISEMDDTLKVAEYFSLDCASKKKGISKVEEF